MMGHIVAVLYYLLSSQKLPLIKLVHVFIFHTVAVLMMAHKVAVQAYKVAVLCYLLSS
jgi:hypothetical protein